MESPAIHTHTVDEEEGIVCKTDNYEFSSISQVFYDRVQHVFSLQLKRVCSLTIEGTVSVTDLDGTSSEEGDNDGDNVDGQLELKELCDAVIDVATPHHRLHDTRKVVISQDNVRRFLRHVRTRYSL